MLYKRAQPKPVDDKPIDLLHCLPQEQNSGGIEPADVQWPMQDPETGACADRSVDAAPVK